jgi:hypothetical protein
VTLGIQLLKMINNTCLLVSGNSTVNYSILFVHYIIAAFNSLFFHIDECWETYGCSAPNLQKLALRVLSQTCSASGCEISWSMFEHMHSKKRNRLEHQRLTDTVFVHCNLRLR